MNIMVSVWTRKVEKQYKISKESGETELALVPECYFVDVVAKLVTNGVIEEAPVKK